MAVKELDMFESTPKERSLWQKSYRRLLRNKIAVGSGIFIILMILLATFASQVTPFTFAEQDLLANNAVPRWMLFLMPEGAENYANFSDKYPLSADHLGRGYPDPNHLWRQGFPGDRLCRILCQFGDRNHLWHDLRLFWRPGRQHHDESGGFSVCFPFPDHGDIVADLF